MNRFILQSLCLVLVSACLAMSAIADDASTVPLDHLQGLGDVHYHRVPAHHLGRGFHVYVRLPNETEWPNESRDQELLPTVYLLDGGGTFPALAGQYHYLRLGEEVPPMILVAISYGATTFTEGNLRQTDFTAPAADRDFWGGAPAFQAWLENELMPFIEARHPSDPSRRMLFGQSLGGQFVIYSASTRPSLFARHIASNPALHRNLPFFLSSHTDPGDGEPSTRLLVSLAEDDFERFAEPARAWVAHWQNRPDAPFDLKVVSLPEETHFSALTQAFTRGLKAWPLAGLP